MELVILPRKGNKPRGSVYALRTVNENTAEKKPVLKVIHSIQSSNLDASSESDDEQFTVFACQSRTEMAVLQ